MERLIEILKNGRPVYEEAEVALRKEQGDETHN